MEEPQRTYGAGERIAEAAKTCWAALKVRMDQDPRKTRIAIGGSFLAGIALVVCVRWCLNRPKPVYYSLSGTSPQATKMEDVLNPDPVSLIFGGSVARLDQIGKAVHRGVTMTPYMPGEWRWVSDRQLTFTPKIDWGVGVEYAVRLDKKMFPDHIRLEAYQYRFKSAPFTASITGSEFYQDPTNPKLKNAVWTVTFSHPVNAAELEKRIGLKMAGERGGFLGLGGRNYPYTISYNKYKSEAYIQSDPIDIPLNDTSISAFIEPGVRAQRGGDGTNERLAISVGVPGMYTYFHVDGVELALVRNERWEPEQVLVLRLTAGALEQEIAKNIEVYELPRDLPSFQGRQVVVNYNWYDPAIIGPEVLGLSRRLDLEPQPTEREYSTQHTFKIKADVGRYLYVRINKGTRAYGGYVLAREYSQCARVPDYPKELKIMQDGSILSLSGEKKVSILSRGIPAVRFEVARVLPGQANHIISQSWGQFKNPQFLNSSFGPDNISERFSEVRMLRADDPAVTQYSAFDLSEYLSAGDGGPRRGLFFFRVESWDPVLKRSLGNVDARMILVTDIGLLVKDGRSGSHDVFVQSIHSGEPMADVKVQILGKNGVADVTATTGADGHVSFPALVGMERERQPVVYVARRGGDTSFLPYDWEERRLNFSRFDISGKTTVGRGDRLQVYLFSDRGIYRPGEKIRVGMIVKPADWQSDLSGVPLESVVTDSRGIEVQKNKISLSEAGFEEISYATEDTSPTGNWQVSVYIVKDGRRSSFLSSTPVRVEEFLPDRMRIATHLSRERLEGWVSPDDLKGRVSLRNLFGTPAAHRRIAASISLSPSYPAFKAYRDYTFFDPIKAKNTFSERLQDGETDDQGEAEFDLGLEKFERGTYRLDFTAEGFEAGGGRSVTAESSVLISTLSYIIGYKAEGDLGFIHKNSVRFANIIAIAPSLQQIAVSGLKAHLLEIKYVSVLVRQPNGTYKYESVLKEIPITKKLFAIPAKGHRYQFPTAKPGDFALVLLDSGDTELARIRFSVIGHANLTRSLEKNSELQILLNKPDFGPGEEIELQIKAPYIGAGLITIERERVYAYKWFKTNATNSIQRIRVPADLEGNGYINVAFVRAIDSPEVYMSPLSYGVVPFSVSRGRRTNPITIEAPETARPGEPFVIRYKTQKKGKLVVFAVDEGVLLVAGYKTPDPLSYFFQKRALEVKTQQLLDLILPEFKLVQQMAAPGGDRDRERALGQNLNPFKRKRDKVVAFWSGVVDADAQPREVRYDVPDYFNGTLRVMAVAVSPDSIGVAEKKATIRGHFVLSPNVPTFAAPGDEFEVTVGVSNNAVGSGGGASIRMALNVSDHLQIVGEHEKTLSIDENHESVAAFHLRATQALGSGNMTFTASWKEKISKASVDLSVRPSVPYMVTTGGGFLKFGRQDVETPRRMYPQFRKLQATVSTVPLGLARGLIAYLEKYPYSCTEQLVSQAVPAVVLMKRTEFGYAPEGTQNQLDQVMHILRARQNAEGAFGFWAANSYFSDFQTVYALHMLTEAKERGYAVSPEVLSRGLNYLNNLVSTEGTSLSQERDRAYALYVLTRNGIVPTGPLMSIRNRLDGRKYNWQTDSTGVYLAAVYQILHQDFQAQSLINRLRLGDPQEIDYGNYYDGLVRDAQLLYIWSRHFPARVAQVKGEDLLHIVNPIVQGNYNTLSSAYSILALDAYVSVVGEPRADIISVFELVRGKILPLPLPHGLFPKVEYSPDADAVRFDVRGAVTHFYQTVQSGFDFALPQQEIKNKLEIQREFQDESGKVVHAAKLGQEIDVHVKVRSIERGGCRNVAVVDLLPGGFEVVMERGESRMDPAEGSSPAPSYEAERDGEGGGEQGGEGEGQGSEASPVQPDVQESAMRAALPNSTWHPQYVDIREDRVVLYGSVSESVSEFVYRIKATNHGTFVVPPTFGESMYDRKIQARGLGDKIVVEGR